MPRTRARPSTPSERRSAYSGAAGRRAPKLLRINGFIFHVLPALIYTALIFVAGSLPTPMPPKMGGVPGDKIMHALGFGVMQLLVFRALRFEAPAWSLRRQAVVAFAVASLAGALLELYQAALPHRSAEILDLAADALGAGLCAGGAVALSRRRRGGAARRNRGAPYTPS